MTTTLTLFVVASVGLFWIAALITVGACLIGPNPPNALVQSALERVLLALGVSIWAVIFWNSDNGFPLFNQETARLAGRIAPLLLLAKPVTFIVRFALNGFRDPREGVESYREAGRRLSR